MTNYFDVLIKACSELEQQNSTERRKLFNRARDALLNNLQTSDPPLSKSEISKQQLALERAIRQVELEFMNNPDLLKKPLPTDIVGEEHVRVQDDEAPATPPPQQDIESHDYGKLQGVEPKEGYSDNSVGKQTQSSVGTNQDEDIPAPPIGFEADAKSGSKEDAAETEKDSVGVNPEARRPGGELVKASLGENTVVGVKIPLSSKPPKVSRHSPLFSFGLAAVLIMLLAVGGFFAYQRFVADQVDVQTTATASEADVAPSTTDDAASTDNRDAERVPPSEETDQVPIVVENKNDQRVGAVSPGANGTITASEEARVFLYEVKEGEVEGRRYVGVLTWREISTNPANPSAGLLKLRGDGFIPAYNLKFDITFEKNTEPSIQATHIISIYFHIDESNMTDPVKEISAIKFKDTEEEPGLQLVGAAAKADYPGTRGFVIGLGGNETARNINTPLLKNGRWIDIAATYESGVRAVFAIEIENIGRPYFDRAIENWDLN